jgi:hypothetical protein
MVLTRPSTQSATQRSINRPVPPPRVRRRFVKKIKIETVIEDRRFKVFLVRPDIKIEEASSSPSTSSNSMNQSVKSEMIDHQTFDVKLEPKTESQNQESSIPATSSSTSQNSTSSIKVEVSSPIISKEVLKRFFKLLRCPKCSLLSFSQPFLTNLNTNVDQEFQRK